MKKNSQLIIVRDLKVNDLNLVLYQGKAASLQIILSPDLPLTLFIKPLNRKDEGFNFH